MREDRVVDLTRLLHIQVPDVGPANLITKGEDLLQFVQGEPNEPYLAVLESNLVDHSHLVLCKFSSLTVVVSVITGVKDSGFPANNRVFTTLGEDKVTEPLATVHVVTMNISSAKVRKMTQLCGENFLGFQSHVAVGEFYCCLKKTFSNIRAALIWFIKTHT